MLGDNLDLRPIIAGYKWNKCSAEAFTSSLQKHIIQKEMNTILLKKYYEDQNGADNLGQDLVQIIKKVADMSLMRRSRYIPKRKRKTKKQLFSKELDVVYFKLKKDIRDISKLLHLYPKDPYLRGKIGRASCRERVSSPV